MLSAVFSASLSCTAVILRAQLCFWSALHLLCDEQFGDGVMNALDVCRHATCCAAWKESVQAKSKVSTSVPHARRGFLFPSDGFP